MGSYKFLLDRAVDPIPICLENSHACLFCEGGVAPRQAGDERSPDSEINQNDCEVNLK